MTGASIILLFVLTRWSWLQDPGLFLFTIIAGIILFLFGIAHLGASVRDVLAAKPGERRRHLLRPLFALLVLSSNVPTAALLINFAQTHSRYVVTVANDGPEPLDKFVVYGAGEQIEFGSIAPAASEHRAFYVHELNVLGFNISQDSHLLFRTLRGGKELRGSIVGNVTNGQGGDLQVTFKQDGSFEVHDERARRDASAD